MSKRLFRSISFAFVCAVFTGCGAVTIVDSGEPDLYPWPDYEESKPFFVFGLFGEHSVNTQEICQERAVTQLQTRYEASDVLWGFATLGVYLPRTAKVWCEKAPEE